MCLQLCTYFHRVVQTLIEYNVGFYWPSLVRLFEIGNAIRAIQNLLTHVANLLLGIDCYKLNNLKFIESSFFFSHVFVFLSITDAWAQCLTVLFKVPLKGNFHIVQQPLL